MTEDAIVEAYAGVSYPERPRSFVLHGRKIEVASVEWRKRTPNAILFHVRSREGKLYDLVYDLRTQEWQILPLELHEEV